MSLRSLSFNKRVEAATGIVNKHTSGLKIDHDRSHKHNSFFKQRTHRISISRDGKTIGAVEVSPFLFGKPKVQFSSEEHRPLAEKIAKDIQSEGHYSSPVSVTRSRLLDIRSYTGIVILQL